MLHHHLPQIISHVASFGRHLGTYCQTATRTFVIVLGATKSPRDALRIALRQASFSRAPASRGKYPTRRHRRPLLIHYHIFKNAGTSFEWALEQAFGPDFQQFDSPSCDGFVSNQDLTRVARERPSVKAIATHQAAPPPPSIRGRNVIASILIRDPIARIRSIYAFERLQGGDTLGPVKARELDFRGYVEWRLKTTPRMFCNFQLHFCRRYSDRHLSPLDASELRKAIASLDAMDIVGTVERYDEWLALAQAVLSRHFGPVILPSTRINVLATSCPKSQGEIYVDLVSDLGEKLAQCLLEQNELDMRLYQVADALLSRRLAEQGMEISLRRAYKKAQQSSLGQSQASH
jgi:hypothetical protein